MDLGVSKRADFVCSDNGSSSQQGPFETGVSREVFRQLEKSSLGLSSANSGNGGLPWTVLLRPFKGFLGKGHSNAESLLPPGNSLTRTKTWPTMLLKSTVDPEIAEARKKSANIDKQIQADSAVERNKCSLMLMHGSQESKAVLADSFAALTREVVDLPTMIDPSPIRESLLCEANTMAWIARQTDELGADALECLRALEEKTSHGSLQTVDEEVVESLAKLWSFEN